MPPHEDLDFVRRVRAADSSAVLQLERRLAVVQKWLTHVNRRSGHGLSQLELEDVKQDALVRVLKSLSKYRGDASLETWIRRVCELTLADAVRKRASRLDVMALGEHTDSLSVQAHQAQRADLRAALLRLSRDLPTEDMRVVRLHAVEGLSFDQIASLLGTSPGGVRARWYRALVALRSYLGV